MPVLNRLLMIAASLALLTGVAEAKVQITVDLDAQTMHVEAKDRTFDWKVSSGKSGYETPPGSYRVLWMDKDHHSDEYDQAPMPHAIFFSPGFAIHGAYRSPFGHPASHGCVRLPPAKAAILFELVKAEGAEINIVGDAPPTTVASGSRDDIGETGRYVMYDGVSGRRDRSASASRRRRAHADDYTADGGLY